MIDGRPHILGAILEGGWLFASTFARSGSVTRVSGVPGGDFALDGGSSDPL